VSLSTLKLVARPAACTCQNPLLPYRPPPSDKYALRWTTAWQRNVALANDAAAAALEQGKDQLDVVFLGDSITEHFSGTEMGEPRDRWVENAKVFDNLFQKTKHKHGSSTNDKQEQVTGMSLGIAGDKVCMGHPKRFRREISVAQICPIASRNCRPSAKTPPTLFR
jgi:hypothetical protein